MNEEMKYFARELEEFLRKGHHVLNKVQGMGQSMGQRNGSYGNRDGGDMWRNDNMGERNWLGMGGYDPRFM